MLQNVWLPFKWLILRRYLFTTDIKRCLENRKLCLIQTKVWREPWKLVMLFTIKIEHFLFLFFVPLDLHFKIAITVVERMFEVSRLTDFRPLLYHFILDVDRHYLGTQVLLKCYWDLNALHKWLVRHSPMRKELQ